MEAGANSAPGLSSYTFCMVVPLPLLSLLNNVIMIPCPVAVTLRKVALSLAAITLGTFTTTLTNDAAQLIKSLSLSAQGTTGLQDPAIAGVVANDTIHINITGLGTAPLGAVLYIWAQSAAAIP